MAVALNNLPLVADNMALVTIILALASPIMTLGPIIMALEQKSVYNIHSDKRVAMVASNHTRLFIFPNNLYSFFSDTCIDCFVEFEFAANCTVFLIQFVLITDIADEHLPIRI